MNNGLKILIERMREFPDDFNGGYMWTSLLNEASSLCERGLIPEEDAQAFKQAVGDLAVNLFEAKVMQALNPPVPAQTEYGREAMRIDSNGNLGIGAQRSAFSFRKTPANPNIQLGSTQLSESDIKTIKKHAGLK
jgi:hypothetical protein